MPWNEPGGQKKDPWGNKGNQGPPDLDELFGQLKNKLSGLFGGGSGGNSGQQSTGKGVSLIAVILLAAWGLSGLYIINDGERGVELRFGAFTQITLPGPHWHLPYPIESVETVNVSINRSVQSRAEMLTSDENIVQIELAVQYNIKDAAEYLFNVRAPDFTMQQAMESAVREVVGKNDMDFIITQGRGEIAINTKTLLQDILDRYKTGLFVTKVNLGDAQPPEQVQGAFADAIKAREDEQRYINEAEAYRNDVVPKARGDAQRLLEEAAAYETRVVKAAQGETERFNKLYVEYRKAPTVTRDRLYLDAMESVLANTSKVMVDVKGGNNMMYLPLDKLMRDEQRLPSSNLGSSSRGSSPVTNSDQTRSQSRLRSREAR